MHKNYLSFLEKNSFLINVIQHFLMIFCFSFPMWLLSYFTFSPRPIIEYSVILSLFIFYYFRIIGTLFFVFIFIISLFNEQSNVYYFSFYDFLKSFRFIDKINFYHIFSNPVLYLCFFSVFYILILSKFFSKKTKIKYRFIYFALSLSLFVFIDIINGSFFYIKNNEKMLTKFNVIGINDYGIKEYLKNSGSINKNSKLKNDQSIILKFNFFDWALENKKRSIVFIIAESFGVPRSAKSLSWLMAKLDVENYSAIYYEIDFKGSTTDGELRSLCAIEGSYTNISRELSQDCLPARLVKIGWSTNGLHGFSGRMFDRYLWWPKIGLEEISFGNSADIQAMPNCGNIFRGACDKDMVQLAFSQASRPKSFVYLLTLSTHLPVTHSPIPTDLAGICAMDKLSIESCMHIASLGRLLSNVANEASMQYQRPLIAVVGDHAPPFDNKENRGVFKQDKVPSFVLVPK